MLRYADMLVETPYNLTDVEDRSPKPNHPAQNQCTYCGVAEDDPWYPLPDITVYRIWTRAGSVWQWRCLEHPKRAWAPHSHLAPPQLQPVEEHPCEEPDRLTKRRCGKVADTRRFLEGWFCAEHAQPYVNNENARRLLNDEDPEAGVSTT